MEMTRAEMVSSYRQAKDKKAQLQILADLNGVDRAKIKAELMAGGVVHQELPRAPRKTEEVKPAPVPIDEVVAKAMAKPLPVRVFRDTLVVPPEVEKILKERVSYIESDIQVIDSNIKRMEDRQIALQNEALVIRQFLGLPHLG